MENLPSEILLKVLSYLDVSSLSCISHVSRTFHRLADDNVLWQKIYISDFGSRTWRPKSVASDAALQVDQDQHQDQDQDQDQDQEDRAAGYWKKMYFRTVAGQDVNNWKRERRDVSPLTGLPLRTRNLNVSWELMLCGEPGQKITMQPSRVDFFESSAVLHFSGAHFPRYHRIRSILLHGVRKEAQRSPRAGRPGWRSLILKLEVKNRPSWFFGKDNLVRLRHFLPGVTIGTWRCEDTVVFIMVTLHFHKLVERSLLGSPVCPYSEPVDLPPADHSDPVFGLHGYTLHFVLHDNANKIMSGTFSQLSCRTVPVQGGLVELRVIDRYNLSQHRSLSGGIKLPWSTDTLEGSVEVREHTTEEEHTLHTRCEGGGVNGSQAPPLMVAPRVELLHHDADPAGRLPEALLVRQLVRLRRPGHAAAVARLRRRALPVALPRPRGSAEDGAGPADGAEAVPGHRPRRQPAGPQGQQALRPSVLKAENLLLGWGGGVKDIEL
ncbi:F-box only protein 15-like isoform X1 [Cyclopterus lumpus]|uniref:F-box only protein 15-like isoform X1 n=1 Tax=Cyclopterus lumpus TaxID=8103 RepID=UPI0014868AEA|nr:F-box only protein 15-like isoform X1 [Cyclopterus lumpus]